MTAGVTPKLLVPRDSGSLNSLNPVSELYSFDHPCPLFEPAQAVSLVLGRRNLLQHHHMDSLGLVESIGNSPTEAPGASVQSGVAHDGIRWGRG